MSLWTRFRQLRWYLQLLTWVLLPPLPVVLLAIQADTGHRAEAWVAVAVVALVWLAAVGAAIGTDAEPTSEDKEATLEHPSSTTQASSALVTTTTRLNAAASAGSLLDGITIASESHADTYRREAFGSGWNDLDGDGCDTRCEVLEDERRADGTWYSLYDGYSTPDASELDIDHLVPLAEAWRSGAAQWGPSQREAFATDLDHPESLIAVTAAMNASKGDRDPSEWQPPNADAWCTYAVEWATVKRTWSLSMDESEARSLLNMTAGC